MENNNSSGNLSNNNKNNKPKKKFNFLWIYGILAAVFIGSTIFGGPKSATEIDKGKLITLLRDKDVEKIDLVNGEIAEIYLNEDGLNKYFPNDKSSGFNLSPNYTLRIASVERFEQDIEEVQEGFENPIYPHVVKRHNWRSEIISWILPLVLIIGFWFLIIRMMGRGNGPGGGGQIFNIGKSQAKLYDNASDVKVTFKDVAGLEEAKEEVVEVVDFLKNPKKYTRLGGKIPKGVLLVGPPGTGKTLLAKSVAGEAGVPFFSISGSDFVEMFVGVGASRVRDLFKQAKEKSPSIIFIDEIDAIGRARSKNPMSGGNDERESTLNQLLTEMDGFGTNSGVIVIAATNRADILDKALMRAGRFDRQIYVELPDLIGRKEIFEVHMRKLKLADDVNVEFLAKQTPGFSGADIANVCNEAALMAARRNKESIEKQDFLDAIDRIVGGLEKKNKVITDSEKKVIAFHEAGHATTSWLLEFAHPLVKVTIVPRGKALGAAWYLPNERQITTKEQMYHEMIATLGGRAAEQLIFGHISTGALSDLEKVTKQATAMVAYYGLDERIGNRSYYDSTGQQDYALTKPFSEKTAEIIDEQVSKLVESAYQEALRILGDNLDGLTQLANKLIDKEVVFGDDLEMIFGKRPWVKEEIGFPKESQQSTDNGQQNDIKDESNDTNDNVSEESSNNINTEETQN
ncbi:MAG: ATP-dependent zinc metalloprotease FtsH [Bacteroidales bacterium]|nr:ATP-dependent zinc metalloprotease FtsH [Bacteroidales bacterium]